MNKERAAYQDRIIQDPDILVGKPVVKGTRIAVEHVLEHLAQNPDLAELFAAYPRLTVEDVKACLAYARTLVEGAHSRPARQEQVPRPRV
jgi:uncharacterized protein (DUF433 family)